MKNIDLINEWIRKALESNSNEKKGLALDIIDKVLPDLMENAELLKERQVA